MLALDDSRWASLHHAYGSASDVPALLRAAETELRPGYLRESVWFDLWSALCHQGDIYSASYAAFPHLVALAATQVPEGRVDAIQLAGSIELARLEGRGPAPPEDLFGDYLVALRAAPTLAEQAVNSAPNQEWRSELEGALAALRGDAARARALFNAGLDETPKGRPE